MSPSRNSCLGRIKTEQLDVSFLGVLVGAPQRPAIGIKNESSKELMKIRIKVPRYVFVKRLFSSSLRKKEDKLIVYLKRDKSVIVGLIL